ncbi:MAG TPA: helix-turn-helix transcriptional regulator [Galbitalea sp.]|nr:helix-turn-helix transcriptional regulator [Galbitalea sp.]
MTIEYDILECGSQLEQSAGGFYGFGLAQSLADSRGQDALIGHGTLYKALSRMTVRGLLSSEWEDADSATLAGRPRRRMYRVTGEGARVLAARPAATAIAVGQARASLA